MKRQLLKAMMFIAIACIATVLFLGLDREQSTAGSPIPEQKGASSSKPASGAMHDAQHNKIMLNMALEKNPGHSPVLLKLAKIEAEDGHLREAVDHLSQIIKKEPDNPEANLDLGKVLFQLGDVEGAIRHTEEILKTHPTYEDALYNMGAIYANVGKKKEAAVYWKRLAALHSNSESAERARQMMNRLTAGNP